MIILLTNDDGIGSPGLAALEETLAPKHDVWVVAPERERSGTSHAISLREPVKFKQVGEQAFSCGGTPADCVLFPLLGAIPVKPDVIISGINMGPNLGTDIIYSGTAAAARQAALMGYPAVAISIVTYTEPFFFSSGADFIAGAIQPIVRKWRDDHFLNINIPNVERNSLPVQITHPSRRIYLDSLSSFQGPGKKMYYFLEGPVPEAHPEEGSDWDAVSKNRISLCPVYLHPVNQTCESLYADLSR